MRWRLPFAALLTIAALLGAACAAEDDSGAGGGATSGANGAEAADSKVEVISRGAEPHAVVEYTLTEGQRQTATMTMRMSMAMTGGGQDFQVAIPAMVMDLALEVLEATDDRYVIRTDFVGVRLEAATPEQEQMAAGMRGALDAMTGMSGTMTMSRQGEVIDFEMDIPDDIPAEMRTTIEQMNSGVEQMAAPFPPAGVGVGAKWRVPQTMETGQIKMEMVAEYHLVKLDGDTAELEYTYTQSAPQQTMQGAELLELSGSGTGTVTVSFNAVVPRARTEGATSMVLQAPGSGGGPPQKLVQNLTTSIEMLPT